LPNIRPPARCWPGGQTAAWKAQAFGLREVDPGPNRIDFTHNFPLWYGPWAGGIVVDGAQDTGHGGLNLSTLKWPQPEVLKEVEAWVCGAPRAVCRGHCSAAPPAA
jgi:hypothetical protein